MKESRRAGFVAIVGRPNVGKSTLLNRLVGERLAIVTRWPQTTRRRCVGIFSGENYQAVFVDTPGLLKPRYALHHAMRAEAVSALHDSDLVLGVADAGFEESLAWAAEFPAGLRIPAILCLNKIDRVGPDRGRALAEGLGDAGWEAVLPSCAASGEGVEAVREAVGGRLPVSPPLYPADELSTAPVRDFVAEMIRESCFEELADELPYAVAVRVEEFREGGEGRPSYIEAVLFVERGSQRGIVVGAGGRQIRDIGARSREKIERFIGGRVFLQLRVKVLRNWRRRAGQLRVLGFRVPPRES